MLVREAKLLNGTSNQYKSLDEAIRTAQFIRNKAVRYWMDNQGVDKSRLYKLSKELASEFAFVNQLNSSARQASVEVAWTSIVGTLHATSLLIVAVNKELKRKDILNSKSIVGL